MFLLVSVCWHREGVPSSHSHNTSNHWPYVLSGGYPSDWSQVPSWGAPVPGGGTPPARTGLGYPPAKNGLGYHLPGTGLGTPQPGQHWVPPTQHRTEVHLPLPGLGYPPPGLLGQVMLWVLHLLWFLMGGLSCYRPHPKDDGRLYFHFVCQFIPGGGTYLLGGWGGTYSGLVGGVPTFPGLGGGVPTFPGLGGGVPIFPGLGGGVPTFPGPGGGYLPCPGRVPLPRVGTPLPRAGTPPHQGRYPPPR